MDADWPRYLLLADTYRPPGGAPAWRFVLTCDADGRTLTASDEEPGASGDRLELLALVRGLEAIDQPARVTLATPSRYVRRGLKRGLRVWRGSDWTWERFGRSVSVRDADLWRRVDLALQYHRLECAPSDTRHEPARAPEPTAPYPGALPEEPVLMVVRSGRRSLKIRQPVRRPARRQLAQASAG